MSAAAWISLLVPVATFLLGHWHVVLPNPAANGMPPLPTGIGHGQVVNFLLQLLAHTLPQVSPVPSTPTAPVAPAGGSGNDLTPIILKLLTVLEQSLQPQTPQPPKAA
jgi:hypothetical protein